MPATVAMVVAQLGPAAMQYFTGRKQTKQANEMAKNIHDPKFDIPDSAEAALAGAERNAQSRYMPGQTNMQTKLDQGTANTTSDVLRTARSPQDALAALTSIHATNQAGQNEIGFQSSQNYNQRQADLRGQQGVMSGWENQRWQNDVLNKFLRDSATSSALKNAGMNNTYNGAKAAFGAIGSAAGPGGGLDLSRLMGGGAPDPMESRQLGSTPLSTQTSAQGGLAPTTAPNLFGTSQVDKSTIGDPMKDKNTLLEMAKKMGLSPEQIASFL